MIPPKEFIVNEFITLKLEDGITNIYVKEELFLQCTYLLISIPKKKIGKYDEINSIDEVADMLGWTIDGQRGVQYNIGPKTEFWGHCSNLEAWYEQDYDTRILHSNLAFPLLKKLTEVGDVKAKRVFKTEIIERLASNSLTVFTYLYQEGYLAYLEEDEVNSLGEEFIRMLLRKFTSTPYELENIDFFELLNKAGRAVIEPITEIIAEKLQDQEISNLIEYDLINSLSDEIVTEIFWDEKTRFLEKALDLAIEQNLKYDAYEFMLIIKKIGSEAYKIIPKFIELPLTELDDMGERLFRYLKSLNDEQLEEILQSSKIFEYIFHLWPFGGLSEEPLLIFQRRAPNTIKKILLEFFLSQDEKSIDIISRLADYNSFHYLFAKNILEIEDWKVILENPDHSFFNTLGKVIKNGYLYRVESSMGEFFKDLIETSLKSLIKIKIIESFVKKDIDALITMELILPRIANSVITRDRLKKLIISSLKEVLISHMQYSSMFMDKLISEVITADIKAHEDDLCELLCNSSEKVNLYRFLKDQNLLRLIDNDKLIEVSDKNDCIKIHFEELRYIPMLEKVLHHSVEDYTKRNIDIYRTGYAYRTKNGRITDFYLNKCEINDLILKKVIEILEKFSSIEFLRLASNKITTLPASIDKLTSLRHITLRNNLITRLPDSIGQLNLESIWLEKNRLEELPRSIGKIKSLASLRAFENKLSYLPEEIGDLSSLVWLSLGDNKLRALPNSIGRLTSLKKLSVAKNMIQKLPDSILKIPNLKTLTLVDNPIVATDDSIISKLKAKGVKVYEKWDFRK